ncbi:sulfate/molybdate ABC transporter ATP-binding protein [Paracoccus benzoatiresistens]|uniref:Sulfate/molybdate ABC transporter ATP-binding protein n=1 Tax=Paracoccus benzoatiresistens TaxID=2997341 RepID=A0ABT4J563_9RHOB|nr:sulfate/molybdate ABC transporter ATP-binding protein [Paracoccus sp. EF6]MCZ0962254.1 sulfate/molybdate ABC transporter ATP-binding protein [Paracoccus sp. EF6]
MSLVISHLARRFGATPVLRGIELEVRQGELIALLGPSGSGKTTLLRIIAGLDWPDAGGLSFDGTDWLQRSAAERRIGFVFQHYALFPHMTVRDNIAFGLTVLPRASRPGKAQIAATVDRLLRFLQIDGLADRYPAELSGGQRQRVALGRAMAIEPRVLLLDEPFGALDAQVRRDLRRWLRGVHDSAGTTTIFVTHDQEEAFELADRVVVMNGGVIEQIGQPDEIYDHPATPFVARFLGLTVELPVTMRAGRAEAAGLDLSGLPRRAIPDGSATLFLRPADIQPVSDPAAPFRVTEIASTGALLRIVAQNDAGCWIEAEVPRRGGRDLRVGQRIGLRIVAGQIFPGGTVPAALPAATSRTLKETRS